MTTEELVASAVAAERDRWIAICKDIAENGLNPYQIRDYETYDDGFRDACNEILWSGEAKN